MNTKPGNRTYTDKEVGQVIQRATEIHEGASDSSKHRLSFKELEDIAAEIGIAPEHLRTAVIELESSVDQGEQFGLAGAPFFLNVARVLDGAVDDEMWERVVLEIRRQTGSFGQVSQFGNTREWVHRHTLGHTQISVSSTDDRTIVGVQKQYRPVAAVTYVLSTIASSFVAAGVVGTILANTGLPDAAALLIGAGTLAGGLAAARAGLKAWTRSQRETLKDIADRIQSGIWADHGTSVSDTDTIEADPDLILLPTSEDVADPAGKRTDRLRS